MNKSGGEGRKTALIVGASPDMDCKKMVDLAQKANLILCADGGIDQALAFGLQPDLLIGDLDSCRSSAYGDLPKIVVPSEKDDTDTMLAVKYAVEQGCERIEITGCFGGRLDHTVANLQTLFYGLEQKVEIYLHDDSNTAFLIQGEKRLERREDVYVSFFSMTDHSKVTLEGFQYPLRDAELTNRFPLGVSNEFLQGAGQALVQVKEGVLLCILAKK